MLPPKNPPTGVQVQPPPATAKTLPELIESGEACLLKTTQIAKMLNCHRSEVYDMASKGEIPFLRIRSMIRFDALAIASWLREHEVPCRY